jgi:predicted DsbA family dithiol-disulfide isomerase
MAAEPISLLFISDFVCPWCYLGLTEVERLQREYDVEVAFAPYLLDPSTPPEGKPRTRQTSADSPKTDMEARGEAAGIHYTRGRTITSNSHLALEAAEFAGEQGLGMEFHRAMFAAYFEELADIGQVDTVVRVGESVGLDAAELRAALDDRRFREQVDEGIAWARSVGVSGVPTFVIDEQYGVVGAQDHAVFVDLLKRIGREPLAAH